MKSQEMKDYTILSRVQQESRAEEQLFPNLFGIREFSPPIPNGGNSRPLDRPFVAIAPATVNKVDVMPRAAFHAVSKVGTPTALANHLTEINELVNVVPEEVPRSQMTGQKSVSDTPNLPKGVKSRPLVRTNNNSKLAVKAEKQVKTEKPKTKTTKLKRIKRAFD